nr:reverse transcriptase domain-containing protein [Tanacetum cinerariifolium]
MNFMVVRSPSPYNGIIGRMGVRKIRAIPSTAHGMIKFPVTGEIVTLQSSRIIPLECSMVSESGVVRPSINQVKEKNTGGNSSGTNHSNRIYPNRGRTKGAIRIVKTPP